tara:strand:- start:216 stop:665 length:450 start_codon:yes stop_codon:yes gene_type:complete
MKNDKNINSSLHNIKKALREEKDIVNSEKENNDFFLLENVIEKKDPSNNSINIDVKNKVKSNNSKKVINRSGIRKLNSLKKNKARKVNTEVQKKIVYKNKPIEKVINKEVKPIIQKWISKNLRTFVKKVVMEEFKLISKAAFKQNSASK